MDEKEHRRIHCRPSRFRGPRWQSARRCAHHDDTRFPLWPAQCNECGFTLESPALGNVGYLWIGCDSSGDPTSWWVWDIVIEAGHRGHGLGRQAMVLAEKYARSHGAQTLGLNVFGFNRAARGLYESLGYETTSVKMRKTL